MQFIDHLRAHPELLERMQAILQIACPAEGRVKSADEVEGLLIEQMRQLGNSTMAHWAAEAEKVLAEQLKQENPSAQVRKKKR